MHKVLNSFTAVVDKSRLQGLGAAVDRSRQLGGWCGNDVFVSTFVDAAANAINQYFAPGIQQPALR